MNSNVIQIKETHQHLMHYFRHQSFNSLHHNKRLIFTQVLSSHSKILKVQKLKKFSKWERFPSMLFSGMSWSSQVDMDSGIIIPKYLNLWYNVCLIHESLKSV